MSTRTLSGLGRTLEMGADMLFLGLKIVQALSPQRRKGREEKRMGYQERHQHRRPNILRGAANLLCPPYCSTFFLCALCVFAVKKFYLRFPIGTHVRFSGPV